MLRAVSMSGIIGILDFADELAPIHLRAVSDHARVISGRGEKFFTRFDLAPAQSDPDDGCIIHGVQEH